MASTISKLRKALGAIADEDVVSFGTGFVAVHPRHLPDIRRQFGAQTQYVKWLDQGFVVDVRHFNPTDKVYVVRRSTDDQGASTLDNCVRILPGGSLQREVGEGDVLSTHAVGIVAATQSAEVISYTNDQWGAQSGADTWGLAWYVRKFLERHVGPLMSINATRVQAGVQRGSAGFEETGRSYWGRVIEPHVVTDLPEGLDAWPLVVGPAVLTRAEIYPDLEWCVVEAAQLALRLEATLSAMPAAERAEARVELDKLRAMGRDLLGWANIGSINPYSLVPAFSYDATALLETREVIDGKDWGVVNDRIRANAGQRVNLVCGFEDDLDPKYDPSDGADLPQQVQLAVDDSGRVMSNTTLHLSLSEWTAVTPRLRRVGKTVTAAALGNLSSPEIRHAFDQLVGACTGALTPIGETWSSTRGERGAIGLGLIGVAANPLTASMNQLVNVFLTPGFMDVESRDE